MIQVHRHALGPRVYIVGRRLHHGPAFGLAALLTWRWRPLAAFLAVVAVTDWRDFPFRDTDNH